jgi:hypothetical protein
MKRQICLLIGPCLLAASAAAEVIDSAPNGFSLVHEVTVSGTRQDAWQAAVNEVGKWWSSDHTITGNAANMTIDPAPQGCFCEAIGDSGGVVHMTVTFANPNVLLRLTGGLGPLGLLGVDGNMTWEFEDGEDGTTIRFSYAVGGYRPGGLDEMAGPVDFVIGEALQRLKAHIDAGDADAASVR